MTTNTSTTPRLLDIRDLTLKGPADVPILNDVSFGIDQGKVLAVVGESGSGKTMAARSVLRLLPNGIRHTGGSIILDGKHVEKLNEPELRKMRGSTAGMIFQEPMSSLNPALSIGTQVMEALVLHHRLTTSEAWDRSIEMLRRVLIRDPERCMASYPHEFSGGMRQRIMLASVMLLKPKLLIADEPTTALDNLAQREVLELMMELTRTENTAVMLITHNLGLVARYADDVAVLCRGDMVEEGQTSAVLSAPQKDYTRTLVNALPKRRDQESTDFSSRDVVIAGERVCIEYPRTSIYKSEPPLKVVHEASLAIREGEIVALVGGSGSGKTTLGRSMIGILPHASGTLTFKGQPMESASAEWKRRYRLDCQLVFQDPYSSLDPRYRVEDIVGEPLRHVAGLSKFERRDIVDDMLRQVGLTQFERRYPNAMSGGQRQRVAIARALIRKPAFVVADEPVSALDMTIQQQILELLASLQERNGFACLFISHDLGAVSQIADRILVMDAGRIVEEGSVPQIMDNPKHDYTRQLVEASPTIDGFKARALAISA